MLTRDIGQNKLNKEIKVGERGTFEKRLKGSKGEDILMGESFR